MSVFDTGDLAVTGGSNAPVTSGVTQDKTALIDAIGPAAQLAKQGYDAFRQQEAKDASSSLVGDMVNKFNRIDQAVAGGKMTPSQAEVKKRALGQNAIAAGADAGAVKSVFTVGTVGKEEGFVDEKTKLENDVIEAASSANLIRSNYTREQQLEVGNSYAAIKQSELKLQQLQREQTYSSGEIDLDIKVRKEESRREIKKIASNRTTMLGNEVKSIITEFNNLGGTAEAQAQAIQQINGIKAKLNTFKSSYSEIGPEVDNYLQPMMAQLEFAEEALSGKYGTEAFNRFVNDTIAYQKATMIRQDVRTGQLAAISQLFPTMVIDATKANVALNLVSKNAQAYRTKPVDILVSPEEEASIPEGQHPVKDYAKPLIEKYAKRIEQVKAIKADPEKVFQARQAMADQMNGMLNSMAKHQSADPKEYVQFVQVLASQDAANVQNDLMPLIDDDYKMAAKDALRNYGNWAMDNISRDYDRRQIGGKPVLSVATPVIKTTSEGVQLTLEPKQGVSLSFADRKELQRIERLSRGTLVPMIKAFSHIDGRRDYGNVFKENFERLFGEKMNDKAK